MLKPVISRVRVLAMLLAFGLGIACQVLSGVAMAAQMQAAPAPGIAGAAICPGCPSGQRDGMAAAGCTVVACWTVAVLPAQGEFTEPRPPVVFRPSDAVILAGIATAPEPHPPRPFLSA
jgi:hypothetical protein